MRRLLLLLSVFFSSWLITSASAAEILRASTLPGSRMEDLNVINFSVNAPVARDYYAQFWLIPPQHPDGSYTVYQVFLNGKKVGEIRPDKGNWQSIRIKGDPALSLREGDNVISVGTRAPELPQVESMKLVTSKSIEAYSSKAYEEFLKKAKRGESFPVPPEANQKRKVSDINSDKPEFVVRLPLKYSFFSVFNFKKGKQITITTTSTTAHDFDLVYYGSDETPVVEPPIVEPPIVGPPIITPGAENETNDVVIGEVITPEQKIGYIGIAATSDEKQGLNWKALSESQSMFKGDESGSSQVATMVLDIPKSGHYLLRVRTRKNGSSGIANINVNGEYSFSNAPISYSRSSVYIEPNVNTVTYAKAEGFLTDPFLFIQGSDADRVVAYNDDTYSFVNQGPYWLWNRDSYIEEKYIVETSSISVLNYWSEAPEGYCNIYSSNTQYFSFTDPFDDEGENTSLSHSSNMQIEDNMVMAGGSLKVYIYNMDGNLIDSAVIEGGKEISPRLLGLSRPGFYFIRIESESDVRTMKLKVSY